MSVTKQSKSRRSLSQTIAIIGASIPLFVCSIGSYALAAPKVFYPIGSYSVTMNSFDKGELASSSQTCFNFIPSTSTESTLPVLEAKPFGSANYSYDTQPTQLNWQSVIDTGNNFGVLLLNGALTNKDAKGAYTSINGKIQTSGNNSRYYTFAGKKVASCSVRPQRG